MSAAPLSIALVACMRNEGIFLMEWLAHHSALDFDEIIVISNDCIDGSDALLDRLQALGVLTHLRQKVSPKDNPQTTGMDVALAHCRARGHSHVLHIDADEFLDLSDPKTGIRDIVANADADVIPFPWRFFGDNGIPFWSPGDLLLARNTRAQKAPDPETTKAKCLFRLSSFAAAVDHGPVQPLVTDPVVKTPDGRPLSNVPIRRGRPTRFRPFRHMAGCQSAMLAHYAVRALDVFLMKNDRGKGSGQPVGQKYMLGSDWHRTSNCNDAPDTRMQRYLPAIRKRLAAWRTDPQVAGLEAACQAWFSARRDAVLTEENIAAWSCLSEDPEDTAE